MSNTITRPPMEVTKLVVTPEGSYYVYERKSDSTVAITTVALVLITIAIILIRYSIWRNRR